MRVLVVVIANIIALVLAVVVVVVVVSVVVVVVRYRLLRCCSSPLTVSRQGHIKGSSQH